MKIELRAKVEFYVPVTEQDIDLLMTLSAAHYDDTCKAAGTIGGFIYGWKNHANTWQMLDTPLSDRKVRASFSDLDLCLKIMEWPAVYMFDTDPEAKGAIARMRKHFLGALRLANEKYSEWQTTYEPSPSTEGSIRSSR